MPTHQSAKELLQSLPVKVRFAGFESDTYTLARNGWELSMQQLNEAYSAGMSIRLAMKHENCDMYAIASPLQIPYGEVARSMFDPGFMSQFVQQMGFDIMYVGGDIRFKIFPERHGAAMTFRDSFMPIDATPQRTEEVSIRDFKFFKVANPSLQDILLLPEQVPEALNWILKAQEQAQEEIRKRKSSRENYRRYQEGFMLDGVGNVKPSHEVQAQIITLAG